MGQYSRNYIRELIYEYSKLSGNPNIIGTNEPVSDYSIAIVVIGLEQASEMERALYVITMERIISNLKAMNDCEELLENKSSDEDEWLKKNINGMGE